jgi:hypothetical protein
MDLPWRFPPDDLRLPHILPEAEHGAVASSFIRFEKDPMPGAASHAFKKAKTI